MSRRRPHPSMCGLVEALEHRVLLSVPFTRVVIDQTPGGQPLEKAMIDINGDGKLDVAIGHRDGTGIYWYAFPSSGVATDHWNKYTIVSNGNCYEDSFPKDVNSDGSQDLVCSYNDQVLWFENPRGHGADPRTAPWTMHLIGNTQAHDMVVGDLDGDGKWDIATNKTIYFQNSPTSWSSVSTANYSRTGDGVALLDTGHGMIDLVGSGPSGTPHSIKIYENPRDHGGNARTDLWTMHTIGSLYDPNDARGGLSYESADMNKDGRMDVVTAQNEQPDDFAPPPPVGVAWYEAPTNPLTGTWVRHQVDITVTQVHRVRIADADGDGRLDIFYAQQEQSAQDRVGILYNTNDSGLIWLNQVLSTNSGHNVFVDDVDGDGDPDMLSSPHGVYGAADPIELYVNGRTTNQQQAPVITSAPSATVTAVAGTSLTFAVTATGNPAPTFQWQRNGVNIIGATGAAYTIGSVSLRDRGSMYRVIVSNPLGTVMSGASTLIVRLPSPPPPPTAYLSDLDPTGTPVNGWGPYERDKSNGEQLAGDGRTLTIAGVTYTKGLGVHAASDLRYSLAQQYNTFSAFVGVDAEVGTGGSVHFQVYGDAALLYDSGTMRGGQAAKQIDLAVSTVNVLRLVVTDNGDGNSSDHADWGDAKVIKAAPTFSIRRISGMPTWFGDGDGDDDRQTGMIV